MSRVCQVTGKGPATGNNVSHAMNATRRRFLPNLQKHRFWVESEKRFVKLRVSTKGMQIIDKHAIDKVLADIRARGVNGEGDRPSATAPANKSSWFLPLTLITSTPRPRTRAPCRRKWRSKNTIPLFASTCSTRKPRSSNTWLFPQKSPVPRAFLCLLETRSGRGVV